MKRVLLLPHIQIHNANALSSPYTIGFPAMTAWLGGAHALQRLLNQNGYPNLKFEGVAVCCHEIHLQTYKGRGDFVYSIIGTGNPLDKTGSRPAFIEEARCHLDVSLVIEYTGLDILEQETILETLPRLMHSQLKWASGDILSFGELFLKGIEEEKDLRQLNRMLMPGYVLIERRDLLKTAMEEGQDPIEALLGYLKVMHRSEEDEDGNVSWKSQRKSPGWLVPIATGFQGISPLGKAENQRDPTVLHRFAESVVTLGEFIMPHHIKTIDTMLWHYHADFNNNLYLCQQNTNLEETNNG
jgi:CRISPR-associated protein Csy2